MACALNTDQIGDVYQLLYKTISETKTGFDLGKLIKEVYNAVKEASDEKKALLYAQAMPDILQVVTTDSDINDKLVDLNFNFTALAIMRKQFNEIKNVLIEVAVEKKSAKEIKQEIKQINRSSQNKEVAEPLSPEMQWSYNENNGSKVVYPLATSFQIAYSANPETVSEDMRNKKDPEKKLFYDVIKDIVYIARQRGASSDEIIYQGKSLALTAIKSSKFPSEYLTAYDKEHKVKYPDYQGIISVITDTDGNFIYFKEDGSITDNPADGRLVYQYLRKVEKVNNKLYLSNRADRYTSLVEPEIVAEREKKALEAKNIKVSDEQFQFMVKEIADKQEKQLNDLYNLRNYILESEGEVLLSITNGTFGINSKNIKTMPLSETDIKAEEIKNATLITSGELRGQKVLDISKEKPGVTIDQQIFLQRGDMTAELANKIATILTTDAKLLGKQLSPQDKQTYFEVFISNSIPKGEKNNRDRITVNVKYKDNIPYLSVKIKGIEIPKDKLQTDITKKKIEQHLLKEAVLAKNGKLYPANIQYNETYHKKSYTDYEVEDGKIKATKKDYFEFIKPLAKVTYGQETSEYFYGLNAYLTYNIPQNLEESLKAEEVYEVGRPVSAKKEPVKEKPAPVEKKPIVKTPVAKTTPAEKKVADKAFNIDTIGDILNRPNQTIFKREKALDSFLDRVFTSKADRDAAEKWWASSPLSRFITLERITEVVNSDAFATWSKFGITLYEADGGTAVDLYHEAWHGFSQLFLTKDEKVRLYDDLRKLPKWTNAEYFDIEEAIAEDFRDYARSRGKKEAPKGLLGRIFKKIYNFLNNLFSKVTKEQMATRPRDVASIAEMYDKLYRASEDPSILQNLKPSMENIMFTQMNRAKHIQPVKAEVKNYAPFTIDESVKIANSIDNMIAVVFQAYNREKETTSGAIKILQNPENRLNLYGEVKNRFIELRKAYSDAYVGTLEANKESDTPNLFREKQLADKVELLNKIVLNFGNIKQSVEGDQKVGVIAYHMQKSKFTTLKESYKELAEDPTNLDQTTLFKTDGGNKVASRDIASEDTMTILSSIFKTSKDENGNLVNEKDFLGLPQLEDADIMWNRLAKILEGSFDETEMYRRIVENSGNYPELYQLQNLLPNPATNKYNTTNEFTAETKFWQDLKKPRIPYIQLNLNKEGKGDKVAFEARLANASFDVYKVIRDWKNNFVTQTHETNPYLHSLKDGYRKNTLNTQKVVDDFGNNGVFKFKKGLEFLEAIGIHLDTSSAAIRSIVGKSSFSIEYGIDRMYEVIKKVNKAGDTLEALEFKQDPIKYLQKGLQKELREIEKESEEVSGRLRVLAEIQNMYSDSYSNFSVNSPEKNRVWEHFLDNTITRVVTSINKAENWQELTSNEADPNGLFKHMRWLGFDNNTFTPFSKLLGSIFELDELSPNFGKKKEGAKLTLQNVSGTQVVSKKDNETMGVSTASMDATSKFLQELHTMLLNGVEEFMRHASKQTSMGITVNDKINTYDNKQANKLYVDIEAFRPGNFGEDKAFDIISGYISGEANRIFRFNSDEDKYKNWAGYNREVKRKSDGKTVMAGQAFTAFDDVLKADTQKEIYAIIQKANDNNEQDFDLSEVLKENLDLREKVSKDVIDYFDKLTENNNKKLNKTKFVDQGLKSRADRSDQKLTPAEVQETLVKAYSYNSWIHKFETAIIAYGDFVQYNHEKEEFHKRNAGLGSGGRSFRADLRAQSFVNGFQFKKYYADKMGIPIKAYDGTLTSAIIKEAKFDSIYHDEYRKELIKVYTKRLGSAVKATELADKALGEYFGMKIGDGQGHIGFEAYRMLKVLEGNWSDPQELLYRKVAMGENVAMEDVVEFFPPYKLQYYGNMQTTGLPLVSFHKFSLAPIIPGVAKPGTVLYDMHQKMMKDGLDYVLYESGSKVGHIGNGDEILTPEGTFNKNVEFTKNVVFAEFLKNQTEVNSSFKGKSIFSTQMRKLILEGLYEQGFIDTTDETKIVQPLVTKYLDDVSEYTELLKLELLEEIGYEETPSGEYVARDKSSMGKLVNLIRTNLEREDVLSDELIDFIDTLDNGDLENDLSLHPESGKIEKLLLSMINKRIIKQKVKGEPLVQVSSSMYENNIKLPLKAATEADIKKWVGTNLLPTYHKGKDGKTAAMKVMIAMQGDYQNLFNLEYKDQETIAVYFEDGIIDMNNSLARLNEKIKDDEWLDADNKANRKAITLVGVRIPVQGLNSMEFMEVYEFLPPQAGNIIVPPAEIVAKSGGDFDIDKLTIFMTNIDKQGKLKKKVHQDNSWIKEQVKELNQKGESLDKLFKDQKAGLENDLIEDIKNILELPDNYASLITPNGTFLLKDIAENLSDDVTDYNRFENIMTDGNTNAKGKRIISPTRVLETEYNIYKHESNIVGKRTLGLGAIENTFNVLLNSIGAYMPNSYAAKDYIKNVNLHLRHNTIDVKGEKRISLSNQYDVDNVNKVADIYSQAMNGWVDVEKDAWIFFIQGNYEVSPILLYLVKTGVPVEEAIYFVSQPLVREYVNEQRAYTSTFAELLGKVSGGRGLVKYKAASDVITKHYNPAVYGKLNKNIDRYEVGNQSVEKLFKNRAEGKKHFTESEMRKLISDTKKNPAAADSELSLAMFLHYLQIEDNIKGITKLKMNSNPDTSTKSVLSDIEQTEANIENLKYDESVSELLGKLMNDSVIKSFFNGPLALAISRPLFKLRYHKAISDFIITKGDSIREDVESTFGEGKREVFVNTFRNDIVSFILQNAIRRYRLGDSYMGYELTTAVPTATMKSEKYGAFVKTDKDGNKKLFVDEKRIQKEFLSKAWAENSEAENNYESLGYYPLNEATFMRNGTKNYNEYLRFVIEREYLRSLIPIKESGATTRPEYEKFLAEKALDNTFNFYHLFKDKDNSMAIRYSNLMNEFPLLAADYALLSKMKFNTDKDNRTFNIEVAEKEYDNTKSTLYTKNLKDLSDPTVVKVENAEDNKRISDFFSKLSMFAFLQTGLNKTKLSFTNIVDYTDFLTIMKSESKVFMDALDSDKGFALLDNFYKLFIQQNDGNNKDKERYKDYLSTINYYEPGKIKQVATPTERKGIVQPVTDVVSEEVPLTTKKYLSETDVDNIFTFNDAKGTTEYYRNLVNENSDIVFIPNVTVKEIQSEYTISFGGQTNIIKETPDMTINIPTGLSTAKDGFASLAPNKFQDVKDIFERRIESIKNLLNKDVKIAFAETGYGDPTRMPQELFVYLSRRLYEEFGYLNPGSMMFQEVKEVLSKTQGISDEEILAELELTEDPFKCS